MVGGRILGWDWIRNPWFRLSHLGITAYISLNALRGELCFLTIWEWDLRERAGQRGTEGSFLGGLLHDILFVDVPQESLNRIYLAFAGLVLLTLVWVPPRLGTRRRRAGQTAANHAPVVDRDPVVAGMAGDRAGSCR